MLAANAQGLGVAVRGTSFAAPFVAARLARFAADGKAADGEARKAKPASRYGRGILCEGCRTAAK